MLRTRKPLLLALALLLAACDDPAGVPEGSARLVFFAVSEQTGAPPGQPQVSVSTSAGEVEVTTVFATPDVCRRITGRVYNTQGPADEAVLLLHVDVDRVGQGCGGMVGRFVYTARIRAEPAEYTLVVQHAGNDRAIPEPHVVHSAPVSVPGR